MADQPNDQDRVDPENLEKTCERLARADTSQSPIPQGTATGSGPAGSPERGPADTAHQSGGPADSPPPSTGSQGVSSGLQPGGTIPQTGAGGTGNVRGNIQTPGGQTGDPGSAKE